MSPTIKELDQRMLDEYGRKIEPGDELLRQRYVGPGSCLNEWHKVINRQGVEFKGFPGLLSRMTIKKVECVLTKLVSPKGREGIHVYVTPCSREWHGGMEMVEREGSLVRPIRGDNKSWEEVFPSKKE